MTPERWQQVDEIYHAALERDASQRAAFLDQACVGDAELRNEVDSLIASHEQASSFIADLKVTAQMLAREQGQSLVGRMISHYKVVSLLGAGGMGEVYLAKDTRLGRSVALKLLPAHFTQDIEHLRRFEQEARAVATLSHPNVCTIHEVVETGEGRHCIVMEYVEGTTLRSILSGRRLEIKKALELAAQIANGLAAAHKAGIIHRDIKPENLMVATSGQVKILDFGLAKLVGKQATSLVNPELTATVPRADRRDIETVSGVILGTVAYMSPEQAQGHALDHGTDIFSLGVVLYEMLTGARPFQARSSVETLHAIINQEPPPVLKLNPRSPLEIADILDKALAKDPGERYRHALDFELDLRRLKRAIESDSLLSAQARLAAGPRARRTTFVWATVSLLLVVAAASAAWMLGRSNARTTISPARSVSLGNIMLTPLTTDAGYEGDPTYSPDGQTIAYMSDRTGNFEIFLKQISGGPDINITNNLADDAQPAFSPDGKQIAFVSTRSGTSSLSYFGRDPQLMGGDVWVMPALGGAPRRIAESGNFPSWSPDGSAVVYTGGPQLRQKILRVAASGGDPREVLLNFTDEPSPRFLLNPSYSSDGRWILFAAEGLTTHTVYVVSAEGGEPQRVAQGRSPVWGANSGAIICTNDERGKNHSLWQIPFDLAEGKVSGEARPLTVGRGRDTQATVSRDGKSIVFTAQQLSFNLEVTSFDAEQGRSTGAPQPITSGSDVIHFMNFSPDGRSVAFESHRGASFHIWRLDRGAPPVQLTGDPNYDDRYPRWSPDGRTIAFSRKLSKEASANNSLWVMAADGANPQLVVEKAGLIPHSWMPDSRGLVYFSPLDSQIHLFDLTGKSARRLTDEPHISLPAVSPDGKWLIFQSTLAGNIDLRAIPVEGGKSRNVVNTPHQDFHPFVSPSGRWLYFQRDHKNIYRVPGPAQDWRPSAPEKVTNFPESGLFLEDPQISRDGHQLLYSRGRITGDIWIMNLGK